MRLSGHNYDNSVFNSLLDNISKDVTLNKTAAAKVPQPNFDLNFTKVTENTFNQVVDEEMQFMASELKFASTVANVNLTEEHYQEFITAARQQNLRGKQLERAARKYCSNLSRLAAPPQGVTRVANEIVETGNAHTIVPANQSTSNSRTGGYMGMSKNPNSIWDSEALQRLAQKPELHQDKMGDEQIKESKQNLEHIKSASVGQVDASIPDGLRLQHGIMRSCSAEQPNHNPNIGNGMSMFSSDRDFSNIPEKTNGEMLKQHAENRQNKKDESKSEWNKIAAAKKADNNLSFLSGENEEPQKQTTRSKLDSFFDGLSKFLG